MRARPGWIVRNRLRRGRWGKEATEYVLHSASLMFRGHLFSILCSSTFLVSSPLHFFSHPPAPGFCHMQTEGASGVEVAPLGLRVTPAHWEQRSWWEACCRVQEPGIVSLAASNYSTVLPWLTTFSTYLTAPTYVICWFFPDGLADPLGMELLELYCKMVNLVI